MGGNRSRPLAKESQGGEKGESKGGQLQRLLKVDKLPHSEAGHY